MTTEPLWLEFARQQIGVKEIVGAKHNPTIMGWIKKLGPKIIGIVVNDDESPWCGVFTAIAMQEVGITPPKIAVRASSWDKFGVACSPTLGAILRFQRPGGGHVGFYIGEDDTCYHVLGGNQSNSVNVTRIEKARMVACRWPSDMPITTKPVKMTSSGEISRNEA